LSVRNFLSAAVRTGAVFLGLLVFAFGLAAVFFVVVVVAAAFLVAGAAFFGAAAVLVVVCKMSVWFGDDDDGTRHTAFLVVVVVAAAFGLAAAFGADGFFSSSSTLPFPSLTGPEAPFGRMKAPLSDPLERAWLKRWVKAASLKLPSLLLARTYFLRA